MKKISKKVIWGAFLLFIVVFLYSFKFLSLDNNYVLENNVPNIKVFALDNDNYVSETTIYVDSKLDINDKIKSLLDAMTNKSSNSLLLKESFSAILPTGTKILDLNIKNGVAKIDFSKELLNINKDLEDKMIEAITYTVTEFKEILGVELYVEGKLLKYLPNSLQSLPTIITREYGINKVFDITSFKNVNKVFLYYLKEANDELYYVPVTKYVNDDREKIEIIIDDLSSSSIYEDNLISFLNNNVRLINYEMEDEGMKLYFDQYIFDNDNKILEEVIYTISSSVFLNYDILNLKIFVNDVLVY